MYKYLANLVVLFKGFDIQHFSSLVTYSTNILCLVYNAQ